MAAANDSPVLLPGVEQLEATPEILRGLMDTIGEDDANWKPAPGRFSIAEVLEHLSHVEGHCFRMRLDQALERDGAEWEPYDPETFAAAGQYSGRSAEDSFDHWEEQRETNIEFLRDLPAGVAARYGVHRKIGRITIAELVAEWAFHDLGHIRQIAEIIRARKYYPLMGAFQKQYRINP